MAFAVCVAVTNTLTTLAWLLTMRTNERETLRILRQVERSKRV